MFIHLVALLQIKIEFIYNICNHIQLHSHMDIKQESVSFEYIFYIKCKYVQQ